jgi:hypothetical protein
LILITGNVAGPARSDVHVLNSLDRSGLSKCGRVHPRLREG